MRSTYRPESLLRNPVFSQIPGFCGTCLTRDESESNLRALHARVAPTPGTKSSTPTRRASEGSALGLPRWRVGLVSTVRHPSVNRSSPGRRNPVLKKKPSFSTRSEGEGDRDQIPGLFSSREFLDLDRTERPFLRMILWGERSPRRSDPVLLAREEGAPAESMRSDSAGAPFPRVRLARNRERTVPKIQKPLREEAEIIRREGRKFSKSRPPKGPTMFGLQRHHREWF
jgi:hypothetical protein